MNLPVLLLIALPMCIAQVSIVGPSDGNREAQGLTIEEGKGIRYTEQSDDSVGQHYVQGATSGSSSYVVPAVAEQEQYPAYSPGQKSLNYNDDDGFKLNWRSYDRQPRVQPEPQYSEAPVVRAQPYRHGAYARPQPQPQPELEPQPQPQPQLRPRLQPQPQPRPQPQPQPQIQHVQPLPPAVSFNAAPTYLKDLVRYQDQLPFYNNFLVPVRYDTGVQAEPQEQQAPEQPRRPYRGKARVPSRQRRQAQQQRPKAGAPPPEPAGPPVQYHNSLPTYFQQLLRAQAQIPYINGIPEPFRYNPDYSAQRQEINSYFQNLKVEPQSPSLEPALQARPQPRPSHRQKRQAPHPQPQPQQPSADPQIHYSTNIPGHLRELLKFQAEIPNNIIPNQVPYKIEAPFVPQPVQAPEPQVQYPGQGDAYQGQPSGQGYANQPQYQPQLQPQYQSQLQTQYQPGYQPGFQQSSSDIRPVTENQY